MDANPIRRVGQHEEDEFLRKLLKGESAEDIDYTELYANSLDPRESCRNLLDPPKWPSIIRSFEDHMVAEKAMRKKFARVPRSIVDTVVKDMSYYKKYALVFSSPQSCDRIRDDKNL